MKTTTSIICNERIKNSKGQIIGSREVINEFYENGNQVECISRGIVKLADGRVLFNTIIKRIVAQKKEFTKLNLLTGVMEQGEER